MSRNPFQQTSQGRSAFPDRVQAGDGFQKPRVRPQLVLCGSCGLSFWRHGTLAVICPTCNSDTPKGQ